MPSSQDESAPSRTCARLPEATIDGGLPAWVYSPGLQVRQIPVENDVVRTLLIALPMIARLFRFLAVTVLLVSVTPETAQAQTGVVLRFRGPGSGQARNAAVRAARQQLDLTPRAQVERRASQLGARLGTRAGRARVADAMGIDYFVEGRVSGRGRAARTRITIYGSDGRQLASRRARRPIGQAGRADVTRVTAAAIQHAMDRDGGGPDPVDEVEEVEEAPPPVDVDEDEDVEDEQDDAPSNTGLLPVARILLGVDARTRDVSIRLADGVRRRNYETQLYPEISATIEAHPFAGRSGGLRGLYGQLDFAYAVGLDTVERDASNPALVTDVDTTAWRLFLNVGYLAPIAQDRARIGVLAGFGHDRVDLAPNMTLPSSRYNQFRLGIAASLMSYGTLMQTRLDAGYRFVLGAGELSDAFGETINGGAFDVGLSIGGFIEAGFSYNLRFSYTRYKIDFAGAALDEPAADGTDSSVSFGLQIGWAIR